MKKCIALVLVLVLLCLPIVFASIYLARLN